MTTTTGPAESTPLPYAEELSWAEANAAVLARYPGEYVALADGEIVAHSRDLDVVMAELRQRQIVRYYLVPVPYSGRRI